MENKITIILAIVLFPFIYINAQTDKTEVFVISTIHKAHNANPNYTYDSLFNFIKKYNPDVIGVEIRPEDIDSSLDYLKANYPYEMYVSITQFPSQRVLGIDWMGENLAGKPIPQDYWKEKSHIKKLQQKLNTDSVMQQKLSILDPINEEKINLALNASLRELNDGRYDLINSIFYRQLEFLLKDTEYQSLTDFYKKRDEMISQNCVEIIKANTGNKIIFLVGADHRDFILKKIRKLFEDTILLNDFDK